MLSLTVLFMLQIMENFVCGINAVENRFLIDMMNKIQFPEVQEENDRISARS